MLEQRQGFVRMVELEVIDTEVQVGSDELGVEV
jgi:hypothetical protein